MMLQFKVCRAVYAGYTLFTLFELDADGYIVSERTIGCESNNISLRQSF